MDSTLATWYEAGIHSPLCKTQPGPGKAVTVFLLPGEPETPHAWLPVPIPSGGTEHRHQAQPPQAQPLAPCEAGTARPLLKVEALKPQRCIFKVCPAVKGQVSFSKEKMAGSKQLPYYVSVCNSAKNQQQQQQKFAWNLVRHTGNWQLMRLTVGWLVFLDGRLHFKQLHRVFPLDTTVHLTLLWLTGSVSV